MMILKQTQIPMKVIILLLLIYLLLVNYLHFLLETADEIDAKKLLTNDEICNLVTEGIH